MHILRVTVCHVLARHAVHVYLSVCEPLYVCSYVRVRGTTNMCVLASVCLYVFACVCLCVPTWLYRCLPVCFCTCVDEAARVILCV